MTICPQMNETEPNTSASTRNRRPRSSRLSSVGSGLTAYGGAPGRNLRGGAVIPPKSHHSHSPAQPCASSRPHEQPFRANFASQRTGGTLVGLDSGKAGKTGQRRVNPACGDQSRNRPGSLWFSGSWLGNKDLSLAPQVGLEPTTLRLTAECSTIELLRSSVVPSHLIRPFLAVSNFVARPRPPLKSFRLAVRGGDAGSPLCLRASLFGRRSVRRRRPRSARRPHRRSA